MDSNFLNQRDVSIQILVSLSSAIIFVLVRIPTSKMPFKEITLPSPYPETYSENKEL